MDCNQNSSSQEVPSDVSAACKSPLVAFMPRLQPAALLQSNSDGETRAPSHGPSRLQLLSPQPGAILEADRVQHFVVVAPAAAAVAVGSEQSGWTVLQPRQADESGAPAGCGGGGDDSGLNACAGVFEGDVMLPRVSTCFIAVQEQSAEQGPTQAREAGSSAGSAPEGVSSPWVPLLGLHVWPPVSVGEPCVGRCVGWDGLSTHAATMDETDLLPTGMHSWRRQSRLGSSGLNSSNSSNSMSTAQAPQVLGSNTAHCAVVRETPIRCKTLCRSQSPLHLEHWMWRP